MNLTTTVQILEWIGFDTRCEIPVYPGFYEEVDLYKMGDKELERQVARAKERSVACDYKLDYIESLRETQIVPKQQIAA